MQNDICKHYELCHNIGIDVESLRHNRNEAAVVKQPHHSLKEALRNDAAAAPVAGTPPPDTSAPRPAQSASW